MTPVLYHELRAPTEGESSETIALRVQKARTIQMERYKNEPGIYTNAQMKGQHLKKYCLCVVCCGRLVDEQIVVSRTHFHVVHESTDIEKFFFFVGQISSYTHVGFA